MVEINNELRETYNEDNQIRFKTSMSRSSLCDYSDAYILAKGTVKNTVDEGAANNAANKNVILKNCALFTNCISRINNTQVDDVHDIDVVMPTYNLIEYSDNYSKKLVWNKGKNNRQNRQRLQKKGKILVPYISNFWRTLEIPLITCEINLNLNWSKKCVIVVTDVAN